MNFLGRLQGLRGKDRKVMPESFSPAAVVFLLFITTDPGVLRTAYFPG